MATEEPVNEVMLPQVNFEMDALTVVVLYEGSRRSEMDRGEVQRLLNEHVQYTIGLAAAGHLLSAGAIIDSDPSHRLTGLGFSTLSPEEVSRLVEQDPAVKVGLEAFKVVTYRFPKGALSFPRRGQGE